MQENKQTQEVATKAKDVQGSRQPSDMTKEEVLQNISSIAVIIDQFRLTTVERNASVATLVRLRDDFLELANLKKELGAKPKKAAKKK